MIETMLGEWQARIDKPFYAHQIDLWLCKPKMGGSLFLQPDGTTVFVKEGEGLPLNTKPFVSLGGYEGKQILQAIANALAEEGVKTPNDHRLQGLLDAQSVHLKDMRTLLKLK